MAAHAVHLRDGGAALEQRLVHRLLVFQRQAGAWRGEQRGTSTGDQRQDHVVGAETAHALANALRGFDAGGIRDRVRRLDDLDPAARHVVAVAGDDQPFERAGPVVFDRARHRRRGLAGADDDQPPLGRRRQVLRQAQRRLRGRHRGVEHPSQQVTLLTHDVCPQGAVGTRADR